MKRLISITILIFTLSSCALGADADTLALQLRMTTGERSRDSSSTTTSVSISGDTIVYKETHGGGSRGRLPEQLKEFKLEAVDKARLVEIIKSRNLLVTDSIERTEEDGGNTYYFALSLSSEVNGRNGLITVKGPRKAIDIKDEKVYQDAVVLIEAVFKILHRADKEIIYQALIH